MLTLPFFATQAEIVLESEPVAPHATAVPPMPSASTARKPRILRLMWEPLSAVFGGVAAPRFSPRAPILRRKPAGRKEPGRVVGEDVSVRAPHLYRSLRGF